MRGTCMQPRKPRRTDTLSSDTPPTTRLLIRSPGSWFPICIVSCAERGAGPLPADTRLGRARSEAETQPHWASPRPGGRPCLTQGATQPFPWTARLCMCETGGVQGAAGGHGPCPSPATVDGWGTWATVLLLSWAPPMSHCVRKPDKLENVKLVCGGRNLGKSQPDPQAQNTAAVHSQNQVWEKPGLQELLGTTGKPPSVWGSPRHTSGHLAHTLQIQRSLSHLPGMPPAQLGQVYLSGAPQPPPAPRLHGSPHPGPSLYPRDRAQNGCGSGQLCYKKLLLEAPLAATRGHTAGPSPVPDAGS